MKTTQLELPGFGSQPGFKPKRTARGDKCPRWYYIHRKTDDMMLCSNDAGEYEWRIHDTINDIPHLFNTRSLARNVAILHSASVEMYKWRL